jgi:hypothetical protein
VVDLDGTLVQGRWPGLGEWIPGAREALRAFLDAGYRVRVFSCRLHSKNLDETTPRDGVDHLYEQMRVRKLLTDAGFPEVEIVFEDKPAAVLYLDDKGLRFDGSWKRTLRQVKRLGLL